MKSDSALELWKKSIKEIRESGIHFVDRRKRVCIEKLFFTLHLTSLKDISVPIKRLAQFDQWQYPDMHEVSQVILNYQDDKYEYNYGKRLFSYSGKVNQIDDFVIPLLKKDSHARQAVATFANPLVDSKMDKGNYPCILECDFKLRDSQLHLSTMIRSCDMFIGLPANLLQLATLQKYVAKALGVQTGSLIIFISSAHIYDDYSEELNEILF